MKLFWEIYGISLFGYTKQMHLVCSFRSQFIELGPIQIDCMFVCVLYTCIYSTCTFESVFLKRTILRFIFILPSISFFFFFFCFDIIFLFRSRSRSRTRSRLNDISWFTLTVTVFFFVSIRTLIAYSSYLFYAYYIRVLRSCTTYWFYFPSSFSHGDDRMGDSSGGDWRLAYSVLVGGVLFFIQ